MTVTSMWRHLANTNTHFAADRRRNKPAPMKSVNRRPIFRQWPITC